MNTVISINGLTPTVAQPFDPNMVQNNVDIHKSMEKIKKKQSIYSICMSVLGCSINKNKKHQTQLQLVDKQAKNFFVTTSTGALKLIVKIGSKEIAFQVGKLYSIETAQLALKSSAKQIPMLATLLAASSSAIRLYNGESIKAVGEIISGVLPWFGAYGRVGSVAIDTLMILHDAQRFLKVSKQQNEEHHELTLDIAYKILGVKVKEPTKNQIDISYQKLIQTLHEDQQQKIGGKPGSEIYNTLVIHATACRDFIYNEKGWS